MPQKVQLKAPLIDPPAPVSEPSAVLSAPCAPPDAEMPTEPRFDWFWCASCYIVTERPGDCPSCLSPVTAVTGDALPYGPYLPRSLRPRRRRLRLAPIMAAVLVVVAALIGGLLYRAGAPLGGVSAGPGTGGSSSVHTPVTLPVLGPMALPGQWNANPALATNLKQNFAADNGTVNLALIDGSTIFAIIALPPVAPDAKPGVQLKVGDSGTNGDGSKFTVSGMTLLTIGGYQALRQDIKILSPQTGVTVTQRRYFLGVPSGRIVIDIETSATPSPLEAIETALLAYPGSVGPQR